MKPKTTKRWALLIQKQEESELTIKAFCQHHKLDLSTFYVRKKQLKNKVQATPKNAFIKLNKAASKASTENIKIQHNQTHLNLPMGIEPTWLATLVKALA